MVQSEKMAAVGLITGSIIHDLRGMMTPIVMSAELIKEAVLTEEKKETFCNNIISGTNRICKMITEILEFSRGESRLEIKEIEVEKLLSQVLEFVRPIAEENNVVLKRDVQFRGKVSADEAKIHRCLFNLCNNAIQATGKTKDQRPPILIISIREKENRALFSVTDNGCGIKEENIQNIFEPFFTFDKKEGTGLGLSIVKQIIEAHGGNIRIESNPGEGTTFTFGLQIAR